MASVFFDEQANRWKAEVHVGGRGPGKRFKTQAEAKAWAAKIETELRAGTFVDLSVAKKTTLETVLQEYKKVETPHDAGWLTFKGTETILTGYGLTGVHTCLPGNV